MDYFQRISVKLNPQIIGFEIFTPLLIFLQSSGSHTYYNCKRGGFSYMIKIDRTNVEAQLYFLYRSKVPLRDQCFDAGLRKWRD